MIYSSTRALIVILKQADCGADIKSPLLCSHVRCNVRSCSLACSACSSCTSGSLLSQVCCSNPTFSEGCTKGTFILYQYNQTGDAVVWPYPAYAPAGELDELRFISALQQRLSVLQQDGRADKEFKGEVCVDGLQLWLWAVLCTERQRLFTLTFNRNKKSCSLAR